MEDHLNDLRQSMKAKQQQLQPLIVIVGPLLDVQAFYVVVDDVKYSVDSILSSIDLNFKIFYVFDCRYPEDTKFLWQFFQCIIYEMHTSGERLCMQNRIFQGEIRHILQDN